MIGRQRFPLKLFKLCFLEDALLKALGRGIIFRTASGALCRPEQGELLTADFDVFTPSDDDVFTIPHPLEMSDAEKLAWGTHVSDSELLQPFHQLNRRTFALKEKPAEAKGINHRAFSGMLESYGYRPQKGDEYGGVDGAIKRFPARKGQIVIAHSTIGPYISDPVDVYSVQWQDLLGDRPKKVDPIGYSEACYDVLRMSGAAL